MLSEIKIKFQSYCTHFISLPKAICTQIQEKYFFMEELLNDPHFLSEPGSLQKFIRDNIPNVKVIIHNIIEKTKEEQERLNKQLEHAYIKDDQEKIIQLVNSGAQMPKKELTTFFDTFKDFIGQGEREGLSDDIDWNQEDEKLKHLFLRNKLVKFFLWIYPSAITKEFRELLFKPDNDIYNKIINDLKYFENLFKDTDLTDKQALYTLYEKLIKKNQIGEHIEPISEGTDKLVINVEGSDRVDQEGSEGVEDDDGEGGEEGVYGEGSEEGVYDDDDDDDDDPMNMFGGGYDKYTQSGGYYIEPIALFFGSVSVTGIILALYLNRKR
jgi:hypothetical protein